MQFYHASWYSATFQSVINSAVGHFEQNLFNWLFVIFWVNILGYSENFPCNKKIFKNLFDRICHYVVFTQFRFSRIYVDTDNSCCSGFLSAHSRSKSHTTQPPYSDSRSRSHFGGIESSTVTSSNGASNQADFIQRCCWINLCI